MANIIQSKYDLRRNPFRVASKALVVATLFLLARFATPRAEAQPYDVLYDFGKTNLDGAVPSYGALLRDKEGNLYGTTTQGGANQRGTIFELVNSSGQYTETTLYSFCSKARCTDGAAPNSFLVQDAKGNFYGTTEYGGENGRGTVFKLDTTGKETVLHSFHGYSKSDGEDPLAGLVLDKSGYLYGTTQTGGGMQDGVTYNYGTVFRVSTTGRNYGVLYFFYGGPGDGETPYAGLVMDSAGNLYGTTSFGGQFNSGTVFKLVNSSGVYNENVLHNFTGGADGSYPYAGLVLDSMGNLYGTASQGGDSFNNGTVFKLNSTTGKAFRVLHPFTGAGGDGATPEAGLVRDKAGNLFGTTVTGGENQSGVVFELVNSSGTYNEVTLYPFCSKANCIDGAAPNAGLVMDPAGNLYGITPEGGTHGCCKGVAFEITAP